MRRIASGRGYLGQALAIHEEVRDHAGAATTRELLARIILPPPA